VKSKVPGAIRCNNEAEWEIKSSVTRRGTRRGVSAAPDSEIPPEFLAPGRVVVEQAVEAKPRASAIRRGLTSRVLDLSVPIEPEEGCVLVARHPSGALTFHAPDTECIETRRGATAGPGVARFRIPVRSARIPDGARRGVADMILKKLIKITVLKIVDKIVDLALPFLARKWEEHTWKKQGLSEGWLRVDAASLQSGKLTPWKPVAPAFAGGRSLLLLHGTFSNAASAFSKLAAGPFFERIRASYGDRIFAFDHFTISRVPEENAQMLVSALPPGPDHFEFDVITHSRGGLVLRNLVERSAALGENGRRFQLGHAVLVASPNEGTPLATPVRWEKTVGWVANILGEFPDNPFTTAADWIAESIVWLARHASGGLPGIGSMDGSGDLIATLQAPPAPAPNAYSALVANYSPDPNVWEKLLDVGIDGFFGLANDLVVPTDGGWHVDKGPESYIPAERIGCFGAGGNLGPHTVNHLNFFGQPAAVNFLVNAFERKPQGLPPVDTSRVLPTRRSSATAAPLRGAGATMKRSAAEPQSTQTPALTIPGLAAATPFLMTEPDDTFYLTILDPDVTRLREELAPLDENGSETGRRTRRNPPDLAQLLANYGSARVLVPFRRRGDEAGPRFTEMIDMQRRLRGYIDNEPGKTLPSDPELIRFGTLLFETLFPGEVRRLYDVARSLRGGERLDVIFTSMIPWVADLPWEFAYDKERAAFLATQEIHFVRNVLTSIPAEEIAERPLPLRMLVVGAQPIGQAQLSVEEEMTVIRRGFEPLMEAGVLDLVVLPRATPQSFHSAIATSRFDIVHFIGHAAFGDDDTGHLLFEDSRGGAQAVGPRSLREIFCQRGIRLVFLNACETGRDSYKNANAGAAPSLIAGGVPAVVANQFKVLDQSATGFAQFFYWALAQGMSIGRAVREARIALNYSISGETIDWAVPVLYARNPHARLCPRVEIGALGPPTGLASITPSRRSAIQQHTKRIGVWDVAMAFPHLDLTLARLNSAQPQFSFERVDLSAPIGTWQLTGPSDQTRLGQKRPRVPYLHADRVAHRLQHKPYELKLDGLICITNQRMSGPDAKGRQIKDLYVWWDQPERPIMLFSTAGFPLPPRGPLVDKVLANAIALCLVGQFAQVPQAHARGPKSCILFYNPERLFAVVAGQRKIEPRCREQLNKKIPKELPAIEKLLNAFPPPSVDTTAKTRPSKRTSAVRRRKATGGQKRRRPPR
jgi:hypothetical protein